jgi:integrase
VAPVIDAIRRPVERRAAFVAASIFFNWCTKRSYIDISPISRLEAPKKPEPRERVLSTDELIAVWQALPDSDYGRLSRLLILTGQRAGQWAGVRAEYIAGDIITWPGSVMKSGKAHSLALTPQVRALLPKDRLGLLFPTARGTPFSDFFRGKQQLQKASGVTEFTQHDWRRTWATIAAEELDIQPHIIESVLAHTIGTQVARIYNRARYIEPMRKALLAFEEWLQLQLSKSEVANVG